MTTTTTTDAINWDAAAELADALGRRTLRLVAERNPDAIIDWALEMARSSSMSDYMGTRAASYLELAVLVGHTAPPLPATPADDMRLEWIGAKLTALTGELTESSQARRQGRRRPGRRKLRRPGGRRVRGGDAR
jgi:hypothetical protein